MGDTKSTGLHFRHASSSDCAGATQFAHGREGGRRGAAHNEDAAEDVERLAREAQGGSALRLGLTQDVGHLLPGTLRKCARVPSSAARLGL